MQFQGSPKSLKFWGAHFVGNFFQILHNISSCKVKVIFFLIETQVFKRLPQFRLICSGQSWRNRLLMFCSQDFCSVLLQNATEFPLELPMCFFVGSLTSFTLFSFFSFRWKNHPITFSSMENSFEELIKNSLPFLASFKVIVVTVSAVWKKYVFEVRECIFFQKKYVLVFKKVVEIYDYENRSIIV